MTTITLQGNPIETVGELPMVGSPAPGFTLARTDLADVSLKDFAGRKLVLNIFPSLDTPVCANSVRRFNEVAAEHDDALVLCISADLPFAHGRFCAAEGLEDVESLSVMRSPEFGQDYGVAIASSGLKGLLSRAIVVLDSKGTVRYTEQVSEIAQEPDYDAALKALSLSE